MTPLVVMVAPNGPRRTKADHPNLPITATEIATEAARCCEAGATVLHVHVRADDGSHSLDPGRFRAVIEAVRADVGERMVVQVTTEAAGRYRPVEQMSVIRQLHPEAVSLALRDLIPDDGAAGEVADFLQWLRREAIAPQYILTTPREVARFHSLRRRGVIPQETPWVLFVLGNQPDPIEVWPRDVLPYLKAHDAEYPWALCAFGPSESACVLTAAGLGGHVRVGFENNLVLAGGATAASNADLVAQVVTSAPIIGRRVADIATTRAFLASTAV